MDFNLPPYTGNEDKYVIQAMHSDKIAGDGYFGQKCQAWFEEYLGCKKALLTTSCTHALEMAAILIDIQAGDEVIMPSYTFVSTPNAFVLRGAKIVFVDICPDTMNMDEKLIEQAITGKTKAIVPVHYAGIGCNMDVIMDIAERYDLFVIEDAAQGMLASYHGKQLGSIGHMGTYSFHETKNYTSGGEGGLLIINDERFVERAEIIREKGTNRSLFFRGMVDKYSWVDLGSSYLPSELQAAYLWGQLEQVQTIYDDRMHSWKMYDAGLKEFESEGYIELPIIPDSCVHNAHMYAIKVADLEERVSLLKIFKEHDVLAVFHYVPLHSSPAGNIYARFCGEDKYTTRESDRIVRLPMYFGLGKENVLKVIAVIRLFYAKRTEGARL